MNTRLNIIIIDDIDEVVCKEKAKQKQIDLKKFYDVYFPNGAFISSFGRQTIQLKRLFPDKKTN